MTELMRKVLQADKIIHEQQLGLNWFPPSEHIFQVRTLTQTLTLTPTPTPTPNPNQAGSQGGAAGPRGSVTGAAEAGEGEGGPI